MYIHQIQIILLYQIPNDEEFGNKLRNKCLELKIKSTKKYTNKMFPGSTNL